MRLSTWILAEPSKKDGSEILWEKKNPNKLIQRKLIGSVSEARVINAVLHLIRARGRVVRQEARTRSCCPDRWCRK